MYTVSNIYWCENFVLKLHISFVLIIFSKCDSSVTETIKKNGLRFILILSSDNFIYWNEYGN